MTMCDELGAGPTKIQEVLPANVFAMMRSRTFYTYLFYLMCLTVSFRYSHLLKKIEIVKH